MEEEDWLKRSVKKAKGNEIMVAKDVVSLDPNQAANSNVNSIASPDPTIVVETNKKEIKGSLSYKESLLERNVRSHDYDSEKRAPGRKKISSTMKTSLQGKKQIFAHM